MKNSVNTTRWVTADQQTNAAKVMKIKYVKQFVITQAHGKKTATQSYANTVATNTLELKQM